MKHVLALITALLLVSFAAVPTVRAQALEFGIESTKPTAKTATASVAFGYVRMVLHGLCGVKLDTDGISFKPTIPKGMSPVAVYEPPYRQAELEIHITGEGQQVGRITINGKEARTLPTTATGKQVVKIEMAEGNK